jgi:hypothetical protein
MGAVWGGYRYGAKGGRGEGGGSVVAHTVNIVEKKEEEEVVVSRFAVTGAESYCGSDMGSGASVLCVQTVKTVKINTTMMFHNVHSNSGENLVPVQVFRCILVCVGFVRVHAFTQSALVNNHV